MRYLLAYLLSCLVACATAFADPPAAEPEVRGTWMTTTANDAIATPANTAESMQRLRAIGLNVVYVETWKNGYTQYPSEVLMTTIGVDRRPALMPADPGDPAERYAEAGRDLLEETLIQAHRNQLIYIGWFEYGFMAAHKDTQNHLREQYPEWMMTTREGELVSDQNPFVWMNPLRPECQDFLMGIILEAVDKYDLDGVQLDDRIAWPVTMGYDPYTVEVYRSEHNGQDPPEDPRDPAWVQWRADKVTEFAERFYRELKAARPNLIVSISPAVYPWSLDNYSCDWPTWMSRGWMQEYVPQNYRYDYEAFANTWHQQLSAATGMHDRLVAGSLMISGDRTVPWEDLQQEYEMVREAGGAGHVHWFSKGVLEHFEDELTAFYDVANVGHAAYPMLPADWRPAPVVAYESGHAENEWAADVEDAGHYRVIAQRGDVWTVEEVLEFDAGHHHIVVVDADAVELLVDRRHTAPLGAD